MITPLIYEGIIQVINLIRDLPILQYSTVNSAIMQQGHVARGTGGEGLTGGEGDRERGGTGGAQGEKGAKD